MRFIQTMLVVSLFSGVCLVSGCTDGAKPLEGVLKPGDASQKTSQSAARQFQDTSPDGPTALESAIELSKKYAVLSEEMSALKLANQNLTAENRRHVQQAAVMEKELAQAQKELSEANDLLIEMRIELNNWKADVLGFRDEIRQANTAQLEALMKILTVLGGNVPSGQN